MTMINFLSLLTFTTLLAAGQLLFKKLGLLMKGQPFVEGFISVARSPALYLALSIYGCSTLLWIWILSRVPLSQAYPWVAIGIGVVPMLAWLLFNERVSSAYWIGIAFVMLGVLLTQYASS